PPAATLFPYTTLFRSAPGRRRRPGHERWCRRRRRAPRGSALYSLTAQLTPPRVGARYTGEAGSMKRWLRPITSIVAALVAVTACGGGTPSAGGTTQPSAAAQDTAP